MLGSGMVAQAQGDTEVHAQMVGYHSWAYAPW
jgi:hypothetical protein